MLINLTVAELRSVAHAGASLEVDGARFTTDELRSIAHALSKNSYLKVFNGNSKTVDELRSIAHAAAPGNVIFA